MEDQPTSPSGVTPDVPARPRRAHRMPVGKARRATTVESPAADADQAEEAVAEAETSAAATELDEPAPAADAAEVTDAAEDEAASDDTVTDDAASDDTAPDDAAPDETVTDDETPREFKERKPAGRWLKVAVATVAALFVAAGAFAGATVQPYLADRALVAIKRDVASTAANAITTLWTYTPEDMETLPDRAAQFLSSDFEDAYRQYVDGIAATNKQAQVTNDTQVLGAAVESIGPSEATAIVFTNSTATSALTKGIPSLRYVSYRLTLVRGEDKWLVTKMSTITSLDLTPQL